MTNGDLKHTKTSLIADLRASGINDKGALLIHSSMKSAGECENGADTVLDALIEFMKDGLLILPTHTWDTVTWEYIDEDGVPHGSNNVYDPVNTLSCVGILTNLFLKRKGVVRSLHPSHSVAAIGDNFKISAEEFIKGEELTSSPCSRNGCYGKLYDLNAQILFLGVDLSKNTFLHGVEEWNNVPDRLTLKPQELFIKTNSGLISCFQHRHFSTSGDVSKNYIKTERAFSEKGALKYCKIGSANCIILDARRAADLVSFCLKKKPDLFSDLTPLEEELYSDFD